MDGVGVGTNPAAGLRAKRQKLVYLGPIELKPFQIFQQIHMADQVCLKHGTSDFWPRTQREHRPDFTPLGPRSASGPGTNSWTRIKVRDAAGLTHSETSLVSEKASELHSPP